MKEMLKNKITIWNIAIVVFIIICVAFSIYYINNLIPKKIKISEENQVEETENIIVSNIEIGKLFSKIEVKIKLDEADKKNYVNYTLGPGKDYYINYKIILQNEKTCYSIKTTLMEKQENEIVLMGFLWNDKLKKSGYEIGILQQDYESDKKQKIEKYYSGVGSIKQIGVENERENK